MFSRIFVFTISTVFFDNKNSSRQKGIQSIISSITSNFGILNTSIIKSSQNELIPTIPNKDMLWHIFLNICEQEKSTRTKLER